MERHRACTISASGLASSPGRPRSGVGAPLEGGEEARMVEAVRDHWLIGAGLVVLVAALVVWLFARR